MATQSHDSLPDRMTREGVIRFQAEHRQVALPRDRVREMACALSSWRAILAHTGLIGQDPIRYGGAGFGNVSGRLPPYPGDRGARPFLITGSQTGGKEHLSLHDYCIVEAYDDRRNWTRSKGPVLPSSESLTHGALYDLSPRIRYVLHGHCPVIWRNAETLALPTTHPAVEYGTPEMAREMRRLYQTTSLADRRVLAMGGHEDGIVAFGGTLEETGASLMATLAKAYERVCLG
jgi:ribulose-5-phosphate 4-epimerase/fuculose-1-phosphate aldolase